MHMHGNEFRHKMHLVTKLMTRYMEISMYLNTCNAAGYEIFMYLHMRNAAGYMEIFMYLNVCNAAGYMEFPCSAGLLFTYVPF